LTKAIAKEHFEHVKMISKGCSGPHVLGIAEAMRSLSTR
jgi:hypothetical protein